MFEFKKRYHYVPPCPKCNSPKTGYFVPTSLLNSQLDKIILSHLSKGELVRPKLNNNGIVYENAYCEDCGCEWYANIDIFHLNSAQINKEKIKRGITTTQCNDLKNMRKTIKQKKKEEKKNKRNQMKKFKKQKLKQKETFSNKNN